MKTRDFSILLQSWLRLPASKIERGLVSLRKEGMFPRANMDLSYINATNGLIAVLASCLEEKIEQTRIKQICTMSLEGEKGKDPLDERARVAFCALVGESLGIQSLNGYLNFGECLAEALIRQKQNINSIELDTVKLSFYGEDAGGEVTTRTRDGERFTFKFTPSAQPLRKRGIERSTSVDRAILSGLGFIIEGDAIRKAGT